MTDTCALTSCTNTFAAKPGRLYCSRACAHRAWHERHRHDARLPVGQGHPAAVRAGETCGRLTVGEQAEAGPRGRRYHCACSCGGLKVVTVSDLREGRVKSCGCLVRDQWTLRPDLFRAG